MIVEDQATMDAWTPMPTAVAEDEIGTAEAVFHTTGSTVDAFHSAVEVLRFSEDPAQQSEFQDYLADLARAVLNSELPYPFVEGPNEVSIPPAATVTVADVGDLALTNEFKAACEATTILKPTDYGSCAHFAGVLAPQRVSALTLVPEEKALPLARDGLVHLNHAVVRASISVICFYQADQDYDAVAAVVSSLVSATPDENLFLARSIAACDDPALDALGVGMLDGDNAMYDVLRSEALSKLPPP